MTLPQVGQVFGRYRIDDVIGRGGMGVVLGATDTALGRRVALKVVAADLGGAEEFRVRFEREAATLAKLASPHVIAIYDYGTQDDCPYIATQFIAGGDLGVYLRDRGPMTPGDALRVCAQVADALDDAHRAGVVHRDVKPTNVLVRDRDADEPHVYLCDFGIARDGTDGLTKAGAVAGTWSYLAPENGRGVPASTSSDLYAVGCLLWATLTGAPPYRGTDVEIALAHQRDPVRQLPGDSPAVRAVNAVLARAMAKDPHDRYPDAGELRAAMLGAAATPGVDEPLTDVPVDDPTMLPRSPTPGSAPTGPPTPTPTPGSWSPAYPSPPAPPYAAPGEPQGRPRKGRGLLVAGIVAALVVVGGGVAAMATLGGGDDDPEAGPTSGAPTSGSTDDPAPTDPTGTGEPAPAPTGPITGDLDGDGLGDLVVDYQPRDSDVLQGTTFLAADGTFGTPETVELGPAKGSPTWRLLGHLDDDGITDVLTLSRPGNTGPVLVSATLSGGGTVDGEIPADGKVSSNDALADVDGDGIDELLHLEVEGQNRIVLSSRALEGATFGEPVDRLTITDELGSFAIWNGDFDGDGAVDIATLVKSGDYDNGYPFSVEIRIGDGAGGFAEPVTTPFTSSLSDVRLRSGDFDGDGSDELLVADSDARFISLNLFDFTDGALLPRLNAGNIRLTAVAPDALTVSDVNGDGLDDVVSLGLTRAGGTGRVLVGVARPTTFTTSRWLDWDQLFAARTSADKQLFSTLEDAQW